jgi:hypothetical protein
MSSWQTMANHSAPLMLIGQLIQHLLIGFAEAIQIST